MTTLKKEKTDLERECAHLREKLDDFVFLNQKLDEALKNANDKLVKYENNGENKESTNIGDSSLNNTKPHRRQISFDP